MPNLLVFGTSHLRALMEGRQARSLRGEDRDLSLKFVQLLSPEFNPFIVENRVNPKILESFEEGYDFYVSLIGGNTHTVTGLVNFPTRFDFVLPENPDLPIDPGADLLPCGLVRRRLERGTTAIFQAIGALRRLTSKPFCHLESPPPIPSEEFILAHPSVFEAKIAELGLASVTLRYKLWRLHSALFREACEAHDVTFIPTPKCMLDEQGMLRPEGWRDDPTHAGAAYGDAQIRQILAFGRGEKGDDAA